MALSIRLDTPDRCFAPGDSVTGELVYLAKPGRNTIQKVTIELLGSITTCISSTRLPDPTVMQRVSGVTEVLPLFNSEQVLMTGPWSVRPQELVLKFNFTLPYEYLHRKPDGRARSFLTSDQMHGLPPSLDSGTLNKNSSAKIEYRLRAIVRRSDDYIIKYPQEQRSEFPVQVGLFSPSPYAPAMTHRFKFRRQTWTSRRLSWTKGLGQANSLSIDAQLHIPEALATTEHVDVSLSAGQVDTHDLDTVAPGMKLKKVVMTLYRFMDVLCWLPEYPSGAQTVSHSYREAGPTRTYTAKDLEAQGVSSSFRLDDTAAIIVRNWSPSDFGTESVVCPDFKSGTTKHRHSLKICVELAHESTGHTMKFNLEMPFQILPSYVPGRGRPTSEIDGLAQSIPEGAAPAEPPAYNATGLHARLVAGEDDMLDDELPPYPGTEFGNNVARSAITA